MTDKILNTKPVEDFVARIKDCIERSGTAWRELAEAFAEAKDMYPAIQFQTVCKQTKFSISTAYKLAAVARSERLKKYEHKLSAVHSWSVLYAIHALSDDHFSLLCDKYKLGDPDAPSPILTQAMVTAVRKTKAAKETMRIYGTIYVDEEAMKSSLFDAGHVETLEAHLDEIQRTLPYTKVARSGLDEKNDSAYFAELQSRKKEILREQFSRALKIAADRIEGSRPRGRSKTEHFTFAMCQSREECWEQFANNPKEAFEYLGSDMPTEAWLYQQANFKVAEARRKLADRVRSEGREFKYATPETEDAAEIAPDSPWRSAVFKSDEERNRLKKFGEEMATQSNSSSSPAVEEDADIAEFFRRWGED